MNIEIANRLVNLRKSNNLSQEALAEKLGISRQAVSKWERAEASPDTDNLILLARLYQISLDELLRTEDEIPLPEPEVRGDRSLPVEYSAESGKMEAEEGGDSFQKQEAQKEESPENSDYVHVGFDGIHVKGEDGEVHVGWRGIHVDEGSQGDSVHIDKNGVYVNGERYERKWYFLQAFPMTVLITVVYFVIGCVYGAWHPGWLLFLLIPVWHSLVSAIENKSAYCFAWPVLVTLVYLCLGFFWSCWHPGWIIFLTVPLYYSFVSYVRSVKARYREEDGGGDE